MRHEGRSAAPARWGLEYP